MERENKETAVDEPGINLRQTLLTITYVTIWIVLSAFVILLNKYILSFAGFPFPIALTLIHMAFCSVLTYALVLLGVTGTANMEPQVYIKNVLPIAALYAGTLWMGNSAYLYLSVAFIQMLKALTPTTVYLTGIILATESYSLSFTLNMILVTIGVAVASYGELNFSVAGIIFQGGAIVAESCRLVLTQILLQRQGIKLNPISTLYYVAPACFFFLSIPFFFLERPRLMNANVNIQPVVLLISAMAAFVLNLAVFLLIGKTSALTMNVAGVIKDWLLIILSAVLLSSPVTRLQLFGYAVAFFGVCWYNYQKIQKMKAAAPPPQPTYSMVASDEGGRDNKTGPALGK